MVPPPTNAKLVRHHRPLTPRDIHQYISNVLTDRGVDIKHGDDLNKAIKNVCWTADDFKRDGHVLFSDLKDFGFSNPHARSILTAMGQAGLIKPPAEASAEGLNGWDRTWATVIDAILVMEVVNKLTAKQCGGGVWVECWEE